MIESFIKEIDRLWKAKDQHLHLHIVGSTALMLQFDYRRATKDVDIMELHDNLTDDAKSAFKNLAGKQSQLCSKHRMYIDLVPRYLPFLPNNPLFHPWSAGDNAYEHFDIHVLDVVDVIVSKLGRFIATDRDDIAAMAEMNVIDPSRLKQRFLQALNAWSLDARANKLPEILENLHIVQRDLLLVEESVIELPRWIEE